MIRINLIPHKRAKRSEKGQQSVYAGFLIVAGAAIGVFLGIHLPLQDDVSKDREANAKLTKKEHELEAATKNYEKLEAAFKSAQEQKEAIDRLREARAVPAWMLLELSRILTKDQLPTMSKEMAKKVAEDENRSWTQGWDPKHVWITSFEESGGKFRLEGGAQSDGDMTQLALRMQASMYFTGVMPEGGDETVERGTGVTYYKFVITGGVVY